MTDPLHAAREARARRREQREAGAITLGPDWRIRVADDRNWTVEERRGKSWKIRAYYGNVADACRAAAKMLLDREVRASLHRTVGAAELGWKIEDAEARLSAAFARIHADSRGGRAA